MKKSNSFLVDTQIFIWWMEQNKRLSEDVVALLNDTDKKIYISVASIWEIVIKKANKKLRTPHDIEGGIKEAGFTVLPIEISHVLTVGVLPLHHKDPFDRVLIAQAKVEDIPLITADKNIWKYPIAVVKA